MRRLLRLTALLVLLPLTDGRADGTAEQVTAVKLYRSTTIIASSDPKHARYVEGFTPAACRTLLEQRWKAEAATRTSGSVTYKCAIEERTHVKFQPALSQLPMPTGVVAKAESTATIKVSWNPVADAVAYSIQRCLGEGCTNFTQLSCIQALSRVHGALNPGTTVRYKVAGARDASCAQLGVLSGIEQATTLTGTTPPPDPEQPPSACTGTVCQLNWTHDDPVAEGFRVVYGRSATELTQVAQVTPGSARATELKMPTTGVWYFAVKAFAGGNESPVSNIVVRAVQ